VSSAWVGVIGSLGGVAVGAAATALIESVRWRRTERTRWYDDRRRVYAAFLTAADAFNAAGRRFGWAIGEASQDPTSRDAASVLLDAAQSGLAAAQRDVDLIGGAAAAAAANDVANLTVEILFGRIALTTHSDDLKSKLDRLNVLSDDLADALLRFRDAARAEIGLPPGVRAGAAPGYTTGT
jgi:hypothetical protein